MKKIDVFNHVFPKPFYELMLKVAPHHKDMGKRVRNVPMLVDLDERFRVMDQFEDYHQILSLSSPPIEVMGGPEAAKDLARAGNDGMAELVARYPDRFLGFAASLPMNDAEAAVAEAHRAVEDLGARGLQIYSNAAGHPLDAPQFAPLFDLMADYDLPICLHPARGSSFPDYLTEKKSKYEIWWAFGWPYETSVAMARLVFSGLFDRHPNIKILTHHMGAMVPYFAGRVGPGWDQLGSRTSDEDLTLVRDRLKKRPIDYFRMFYADTAVFGARAATECGLDFFGPDHVLFASDAPFDPEKGPMYIRETIKIIDGLDIGEGARAKIYNGNAAKLLKLDRS
jgi:predicted TIM-barrel fold metal-dependent hydrolase